MKQIVLGEGEGSDLWLWGNLLDEPEDQGFPVQKIEQGMRAWLDGWPVLVDKIGVAGKSGHHGHMGRLGRRGGSSPGRFGNVQGSYGGFSKAKPAPGWEKSGNSYERKGPTQGGAWTTVVLSDAPGGTVKLDMTHAYNKGARREKTQGLASSWGDAFRQGDEFIRARGKTSASTAPKVAHDQESMDHFYGMCERRFGEPLSLSGASFPGTGRKGYCDTNAMRVFKKDPSAKVYFGTVLRFSPMYNKWRPIDGDHFFNVKNGKVIDISPFPREPGEFWYFGKEVPGVKTSTSGKALWGMARPTVPSWKEVE